MTDEDTTLEEAMDHLKEAGQRIRATQSLMRSQGMSDGENYRDLLAPFCGAGHDRSGVPRGPASEGSLTSRRFNDATSEIFLKKRSETRVVAAVP